MAGFHTFRPKMIFAFALSITLGSMAHAQTSNEWRDRADEQYDAGQFAASADSYAEAIEAGAESKTTFYNAACSAALAGRTDVAFGHLDGALERGWRDVALLRRDSDLESLHRDPRWATIVARCEEAKTDYVASLAKPELYAELLEMRELDQAMLKGQEHPGLEGKTFEDINGGHTTRMKEIVAEHGWPTKSLVGEAGANSAWLLVQHSDADPAFQRQCLELMQAVPEGEVSAVDLAYLTDRVLVNEGKKQIYGTQFHEIDGERVPRPIEDEAGLDARREALGMMSMESYRALMNGF